MTGSSSGIPRNDPLDQALAALSPEVEPSRDLWPSIHAALDKPATSNRSGHAAGLSARWLLNLAAAVLLMIASSFITYFIMRDAQQQELAQVRRDTAEQLLKAPALPAMPASFADEQLGTDYLQARAALETQFQHRLTSLPPAARAKLENNLADLRRAAAEIAATLEIYPDHALLQELLLSTYQSEMALLSGVNGMTAPVVETRL